MRKQSQPFEFGVSMLRRLVRHPHYKLLAVAAALIAWLYVQGTEVVEERIRVNVGWVLPPDQMSVQPLPGTIQITVEGPHNAVRKARKVGVSVSVDLTEVATDASEYLVDFDNAQINKLPANVVVKETTPREIRIELDAVGHRFVTVEPVTVGEPLAGSMVEEVKVEPSVVELRGPKVKLDPLKSVKTLPIDVSGLRHDKRVQVMLDPPRGVEAMGVENLEARIDIEPTVAARVIVGVPVQVRGREGWAIQPATIKVRLEGPAASLQKISDEDILGLVVLPKVIKRSSYEASFTAIDEPRGTVIVPSDSVRAVLVEPNVIKVVKK